MLIDNCGLHGTDLQDPRRQVSILILPPNCTSMQQSTDMERMVLTWKKIYRSEFLKRWLLNIPTRAHCKESKKFLKPIINGLDEAYGLHLLDVSRPVKESRKRLNKTTIGRYWIKSKILPVSTKINIRSVYEPIKNENKKPSTRAMLEVFKKFSKFVTSDDTMSYLMDGFLCEKDMSK